MIRFKRALSWQKSLILSITALGVVYGDIGTSPLYAIKEINKHLGPAGRSLENVLGYISLVIWTLIIVISFKYIILVLRADNEGEGGVFSLITLISRIRGKGVAVVSFLLLLSVGFLLGDGIITPAISVVSAVEGLGIITTAFESFIVPVTILILVLLFLIQGKGTAKIGIIFGPVIALWFISIGLLGLSEVISHPQILASLNPFMAVRFIFSQDWHMLILVLGSVILAVTGGEALYADMGHFGTKPIRFSWFSLVFPSLALNYLGQGAFLLSGQPLINQNVFYSMVPSWGLIPMVILATVSTIIASQALITGAFSLVTQGISLGLLPYFRVIHTHHEHRGQIYVPFVNYSLLAGCVFLVWQFQNSSNLASAYGLAVSYVMLVSTLAIFLVARYMWKWSYIKVFLLFSPLLVIDFSFVTANIFKFFNGGYIPMSIGIGILFVMRTWQWGKEVSHNKYHKYSTLTMRQLIRLKDESTYQLPKSMIAMTPFGPLKQNHRIVLLGKIILERYGLIPRHLTFVTVLIHKIPYFTKDRFRIVRFYNHPVKGSITSIRINYGFMENPQVEKDLLRLSRRGEILIDRDTNQWLIHITKFRFFISKKTEFLSKIKMLIYQFMYKNSDTADKYFYLGKDTKLSVEILPIKI